MNQLIHRKNDKNFHSPKNWMNEYYKQKIFKLKIGPNTYSAPNRFHFQTPFPNRYLYSLTGWKLQWDFNAFQTEKLPGFCAMLSLKNRRAQLAERAIVTKKTWEKVGGGRTNFFPATHTLVRAYVFCRNITYGIRHCQRHYCKNKMAGKKYGRTKVNH